MIRAYALVLSLVLTGCTSLGTRPHPNVGYGGPARSLANHNPVVAIVGDTLAYDWYESAKETHPMWVNMASNTPILQLELTDTMLARYQLVLDTHPDVIVLLGGMGDYASTLPDAPADGCGPVLSDGTEACENVRTMGKMAQADHIKFIVCLLPDPFNAGGTGLGITILTNNPNISYNVPLFNHGLKEDTMGPWDGVADFEALTTDYEADGVTPGKVSYQAWTAAVDAQVMAFNVGEAR